MKKTFTFVILHYLSIDDTIKCIDSIKKIGIKNKVEIVVVDNASKNNSGILLKEKYINDNSVHIIVNNENLGFTKGNNVGFKYAKETLKTDFIILCNNDTYLIQDDFFELVYGEYKQSNFAVLGPKILLPNNEINPVLMEIPSLKQLKTQLKQFIFDYILTLIYLDKPYTFLRKMIKKALIKLGIKKQNKLVDSQLYNERHENIVLHGCFWIFSKEYIDKFDGLNEKTFLYREEELLAKRLIDNNLKSVYNPNIVIFHSDDSSTNLITKTKRKKKLFVDKNQIKSTKILIKEMIES